MTTCDTAAAVTDFESFYREHWRTLTRLAHLLTGSQSVGEELAQEALLATHRRWSEVDNPAAFARRCLVNLARSHQRRMVLQRRHGDDPQPLLHQLPPEVDETWQLIRRLKPDHRAVLVLRFYDDLTIDEIASLLDRPAGTIKSQLHRALAALKENVR